MPRCKLDRSPPRWRNEDGVLLTGQDKRYFNTVAGRVFQIVLRGARTVSICLKSPVFRFNSEFYVR